MANCCGFVILAYTLYSLCFGLESLFINMAGRRSGLCGGFTGPHFLPAVLSTFCHCGWCLYKCDGCLSSQGCGSSWLGCQVLLVIGAVSIFELAVIKPKQ